MHASLADRLTQPYITEKFQLDVKRDIAKVYEHYYPLTTARDVAFEVGRLCMSMQDCKGALPFFYDSIADCGEHHVTFYNLGLCFNYIGEFAKAYDCFQQSYNLNNNYDEAFEWLNRMGAKLQALG